MAIVFGIDALPNSTTAGLAGRGTEAFFAPMTSSAFAGIRKFGAFSIGRGTDSVWRTKGFRAVALSPCFVGAVGGGTGVEGRCGVGVGTAADFVSGSFAGRGALTEACAFATGRISSIIVGAAFVAEVARL